MVPLAVLLHSSTVQSDIVELAVLLHNSIQSKMVELAVLLHSLQFHMVRAFTARRLITQLHSI